MGMEGGRTYAEEAWRSEKAWRVHGYRRGSMEERASMEGGVPGARVTLRGMEGPGEGLSGVSVLRREGTAFRVQHGNQSIWHTLEYRLISIPKA